MNQALVRSHQASSTTRRLVRPFFGARRGTAAGVAASSGSTGGPALGGRCPAPPPLMTCGMRWGLPQVGRADYGRQRARFWAIWAFAVARLAASWARYGAWRSAGTICLI